MRIITAANNKDYYDRYSDPTDRECVWVRKHQVIGVDEREVQPLKQYLNRPRGLQPKCETGKFILTHEDKKIEYAAKAHSVDYIAHDDNEGVWPRNPNRTYDAVFVVFCGVLYRGIRYTENLPRPESAFSTQTHYKFYWSWEDFSADHNQKDQKNRFDGKIDAETWFARNKGLTVKGQEIKQTRVDNVCVDVHSPVLVFGVDHESRRNVWAKDALVKDLDFFRILDPHTAFQELSMFVGGVMTKRDQVAPVPDKLKVAAHGMDERSFRKDPTKVHR